ncbi:hypothetical protein NL676_025479 [Syzygium grande]|nr:hypothetical protein NL676_025479 [Syzygium grande]
MWHSTMAASRRRAGEDLAKVALEQARFCSSCDRQGELERNKWLGFEADAMWVHERRWEKLLFRSIRAGILPRSHRSMHASVSVLATTTTANLEHPYEKTEHPKTEIPNKIDPRTSTRKQGKAKGGGIK